MLEIKDGFDYKQYLKTKKIVGIVSAKSNELTVLDKNKTSIISKIIYNIKRVAILKIKEVLPEDTANLCTGLLLGDKAELSEDIQESFRKSNLSHMLAISGAHVSYILLGITSLLQKLKINKRWGKFLLILFLVFFMALVGFTPSVTRACIMAILQLLAGILFRKSDTYQNLAISSFAILLANPYTILDIGFQLSFGGTVGIIIFSKRITIANTHMKLNNKKHEESKKVARFFKKIKEMCIVTISANLLILPIMMYHFNTISLTFLISNMLASPILGLAIIASMIFLIALFICKPIAKLISLFVHPILQLLILIANFSSKLPLSQVLVPTPKLWQIAIYYLILYLINKLTKKHKKTILVILVLIIISPYIINLIPSNQLIINFIDVGQGDSTLIQTPSHKTILIDGGGSETGSFDVGEKTLLPYLLDKGIMQIDYMIYSHMDSDHCLRTVYYYGKIKGKECNYKCSRRRV